MNHPSSPDAPVPAQIAHLQALGRGRGRTVEVVPNERGYQVTITATHRQRTRELRVDLVRRKRRWVDRNHQFLENGEEVDVLGGLGAMLRKLSQSGDLVGSPAARTRMPGANPTLVTRSHTIIRN